MNVGQVYKVLGELRGWSHELGRPTILRERQHIMNESAGRLVWVGRVTQPATRPYILEGIWRQTTMKHLINKFELGVLKCVDEPT